MQTALLIGICFGAAAMLLVLSFAVAVIWQTLATMSELRIFSSRRTDNGKYALWWCPGNGDGCARNRHCTTKLRCNDCIGPLESNEPMDRIVDLAKRAI